MTLGKGVTCDSQPGTNYFKNNISSIHFLAFHDYGLQLVKYFSVLENLI